MKSKKTIIAIGLIGVAVIISASLFETNISLKPSKLSRKIYTKVTGRIVSSEDLDYDQLSQIVTPQEGKEVDVNWGDMGRKLIESGAIDYDAFKER